MFQGCYHISFWSIHYQKIKNEEERKRQNKKKLTRQENALLTPKQLWEYKFAARLARAAKNEARREKRENKKKNSVCREPYRTERQDDAKMRRLGKGVPEETASFLKRINKQKHFISSSNPDYGWLDDWLLQCPSQGHDRIVLFKYSWRQQAGVLLRLQAKWQATALRRRTQQAVSSNCRAVSHLLRCTAENLIEQAFYEISE